MSDSSIKIDDIVVSSETEMLNVALSSYEDALNRNFVEKYATRVESTGSEVKLRIREMAVEYKTGKLTDDRSNKTKIDPPKIVTIPFDYSHVGLTISATQWSDSDGEVQELQSEWATAAGESAGVHTMRQALEMFKNNAPSVVTDSPMFGSHTLLSGQTYDNTLQLDLTGAPEDALSGLETALAKIRSTRTKAGIARSFSKFVALCGTKMYAKLHRAISATQINGTDVTSRLGRNVELVEVPEMGSDDGYWNGDENIIMMAIPRSGLGGIIQADREGFSINVFGPEDSYTLNRRDVFEYLADFRRATLGGAPECMLGIYKDTLY